MGEKGGNDEIGPLAKDGKLSFGTESNIPTFESFFSNFFVLSITLSLLFALSHFFFSPLHTKIYYLLEKSTENGVESTKKLLKVSDCIMKRVSCLYANVDIIY